MLAQLRQITNFGRFNGLKHSDGNQFEFKRLTLIFGRNASGKSTLARLLSLAASGNSAGVLLHQTLNASTPPKLTLKFDGGALCRFDGTKWSDTRPNVVVFDRDFIEANVYVGRRTTKEQRKELLRLALGENDVALAREIDALTVRGRELSTEAKSYEAILETAAAGFKMPKATFLALPQLPDEKEALAVATRDVTEAQVSAEILRRPRPSHLPEPPSLDFESIQALFAKTIETIEEDAEARVRQHLDERLRGQGEQWILSGVKHMDGQTCPFCGQDIKEIELVSLYRDYFDEAYENFLESIDSLSRDLKTFDSWWTTLKQVGKANAEALSVWADHVGNERPTFGSETRKEQLDRILRSLSEEIESRRAHPTEEWENRGKLKIAESDWKELRAALAAYNASIDKAMQLIDARRLAISSNSLENAQQALRNVSASIRRWESDVRTAVTEANRISEEKKSLEKAKSIADAKVKSASKKRMAVFTKKVNLLLDRLGADFSIELAGTERSGGSSGAKFLLKVQHGAIEISNSVSEEQFARILSDGDRSTLALAIFFAMLQGDAKLGERIIVLDDPMTSLDASRLTATAECLTKLARVTRQVIVLSHHTQFLAQVAHDWRRHAQSDASQLTQLSLARDSCSLEPWDAEDHVEIEYLRRWTSVQAFAEGKSPDSASERVRGDIRKILETAVRFRWPDLYPSAHAALEKVIQSLKNNATLLADSGLTESGLEELDRLCAFGAGGNHDQSHFEREPPSPEEVRAFAKRALWWVRHGEPAV